MRILAKLVNLVSPRRAERDMTREIDAHLTLLQDEFERQGMSPEGAQRAARRAYGGIEQTKELHRDARSFVWIEQFFKDLRYAWSNLLRNPGFTDAARSRAGTRAAGSRARGLGTEAAPPARPRRRLLRYRR